MTLRLAGRYRIEGLLGQGGMGTVHRAFDERLQRPVAVKILGGAEADAERLLHEARAVAALQHPHIVAIHDAGEDEGRRFIVMELLQGPNLRQAAPFTLTEQVRLARQLCQALQHAHERGIVHRDVKPENVMLEGDRDNLVARLADFGVARVQNQAALTSDGTVVGTPTYLAPELALGEPVDGRTDLYALGAMLYELATGRPPFTGSDPLIVMAEHIHAPVVPPRTLNAEIPAAYEAVIVKLLAKSPGDRYATAADVDRALADVESAPAGGAAPEPTAQSLLDQLARGRLTGRRVEMDRLKELWAEAQRGEGRLVLLSGEPGIGKTRLAQETMTVARLTGARVLKGGSYELEASTPYLPFVEALRDWASGLDDATLRPLAEPLAGELGRLIPELESRFGWAPAPPSGSPAEQRLKLFDHLARLFRALAGGRGLLLFLDDLHWADQGTLSLIQYLLRHLRQDRVLLLGAYREVELDRAHPLAAALVEWNRERLVTRIPLDRFTPEETGALLATLFEQASVSDDFRDAMHRETEGNPFFIEEVVKALIDQEQIYRDGGTWQRRDVKDLAIPQSVKEAIGRRLSRLSEPAVEALHTAAALGKDFLFDALLAAAGRPEDELLDALDEAAAAQLIRPSGDTGFVFTHDKIREVLYDEISPVRRRRLHARIAEALEQLHAGRLDEHVADLAWHCVMGGRSAACVEYSRRAARRAAALYAHAEAFRYLEQARECADATGDRVLLRDVIEEIGALEVATGQNSRAARTLEQALELTDDSDHRLSLSAAIARGYVAVGDERGLPYLEDSIARLEASDRHADAAAAMMARGRFHHYRLEHRTALEWFDRAQVRAEAAGAIDSLVTINAFRSGAYQHLARYADSLAAARECIRLGEEHHYPEGVAIGHEFLAEGYGGMGCWRLAEASAGENERIARVIGSRDRLAWSQFGHMLACWGSGHLAAGIERAREAIALADDLQEPRLSTIAGAWQVRLLLPLGRLEEARARLDAATARARVVGQPFMHSIVLHSAAMVALAGERFDEARRILREADALMAVGDNRVSRLFGFPIETQAALGLGALDDAEQLIVRGLSLAGEAPSYLLQGRLLRQRSELRHRQAREVEARDDIESAIAVHREHELALELVSSLEWRGRLNAAAGRSAEASADAAEAAALRRECGMPDA